MTELTTPTKSPAPATDEPATTADRATAVGLRGVTKRFPPVGGRRSKGEAVTAVDDVDLAIADGEFFSLLGPSGCGKTTTLRMIAGFDYPTAGSVRIFGEEMGLEPPNKRPVNTVFQSYALFPHLTVAQNISFGLEMQGVADGERRQRVAEAIELVQLSGREQSKPKQLSGGQQQRVALARALVNHPKVLLLDEPLGALDLKLRQAMQLELKQLQERVGITFIYVTHDQEEALTMSDRIAVMDAGRVLQVGAPTEIYDRPRTRFVADFIGDTNLLDLTVEQGGSGRLADGTVVRLPDDAPAGSGRTAAIRPEKLGIVRRNVPREPSLDAVEGTVERRTFLGNALLYEVTVPVSGRAPMSISIRQGNAPGIEHVEVGEDVRVRWSPASLAVLED